jgi:putative phage-type endonuclease
MPKLVNVKQGSSEWLKVREGRITASNMGAVIDRLKRNSGDKKAGDYSAEHDRYVLQLVAERLTGRAEENYVSPAMDWGTEWEGDARSAYEVAFDILVDQVGFAIHPTMDFSGASPDALVGPTGCLEIKCPKTVTHLAWKLAGVAPEEHIPQMMWEMECCERLWCDFVSYDPRLPPNMQVFCVRLDYNRELAKSYRSDVLATNAEVEAMMERLGGTPTEWLKSKLSKSIAQDDALLSDEDIEWAKGGFK